MLRSINIFNHSVRFRLFIKYLAVLVTFLSVGFRQTSVAQTQVDASPNTVFNQYIVLKNALAVDNGDSARVAAKLLYSEIENVNIDSLTPNQKRTWNQYEELLRYHAEHIKGTTDIEHQREHFVMLSEIMYKVMKELDINADIIYYQYCPMANDGKGAYWLSEKSYIANPYLGKMMPTCGSTKDSIQIKQ